MKRGFIIGFLAAIVLTTGIQAATNIQVYLNPDIKLELRGKIIELKDANGTTVYPITYDGTTYLPVRAVAESLNLDVKWDANTQTVKLNDKAPEVLTPDVASITLKEVTDFKKVSSDNAAKDFSTLKSLLVELDTETFLSKDSITYTIINKEDKTLKNIKYYIKYRKNKKIIELICPELKAFERTTIKMPISNLSDYEFSDYIYQEYTVDSDNSSYTLFKDENSWQYVKN